MNEAASHAERAYRVANPTTEEQARALMGKQSDAIFAHLIIDAELEIEKRGDVARGTEVVWVHTYALARCASMLAWTLARVNQVELELSGQRELWEETS